MTVDGKTSTAQFSGTDKNGILTLFGKEYPFREVQRSGKTYKELDWNERHVLFPPDSHFMINITEGSPDELVIDAPAAPSESAPVVLAK